MIKYKGQEVDGVFYKGQEVKKVIYKGTVVFEKINKVANVTITYTIENPLPQFYGIQYTITNKNPDYVLSYVELYIKDEWEKDLYPNDEYVYNGGYGQSPSFPPIKFTFKDPTGKLDDNIIYSPKY